MEYKPHAYQAYCINRIVDDSDVGLFLRPGLGKTSITLSAVNILKYYRWSVRKCLVVAPKKVAECTWSKEAEKWDHLKHLRVVKMCIRDRIYQAILTIYIFADLEEKPDQPRSSAPKTIRLW